MSTSNPCVGVTFDVIRGCKTSKHHVSTALTLELLVRINASGRALRLKLLLFVKVRQQYT